AADERLGTHRQHDVGPAADAGSEEIGPHDANDGERDPLERDPPADHVRGASKTALPEGVADHDDGAVLAAAALIVSVGERPAEERRDAERVEDPRRRPDAV